MLIKKQKKFLIKKLNELKKEVDVKWVEVQGMRQTWKRDMILKVENYEEKSKNWSSEWRR